MKKGSHHTEEALQKISKNHADINGENNPMFGKGYLRCGSNNPFYGRRHTSEFIQSRTGANNPAKRPEVRKSLRIAAINNLEFKYGQLFPNYNPEACKLIDEYGKQHNYNFQHAMNGGEYHIKELGYWVDGYDKEKNMVIEYYEKKHEKTVDKDKQREEEIKKFLNCTMIILQE